MACVGSGIHDLAVKPYKTIIVIGNLWSGFGVGKLKNECTLLIVSHDLRELSPLVIPLPLHTYLHLHAPPC